jgi:predicted nucleic acid-binding protein
LERKEIPRYIPDASVALKWFIEERDTSHALRLKELFEKGRIDLEAPSLLGYEVASALRFHPKVKVTLKQFGGVTEALADMQIMREPTHLEWLTAFRLSLENAISIYDAIYLGFAVSRQSKMVTADTSLLSKTRSAEAKGSLLALTDLALSI